jgi:hypothetical protein
VALTPDPGGTGTVTSDYDFTGSEPSILVESGNRVVKAVTLYAREKEFGIEFQFTIPRTEYMGSGPEGAAGLRAGWLQAIGIADHVQAVSVVQDVNAQGFLRDYVLVTVGSDDGQFTADTQILLDSANTPGAFQQIANTWAAVAKTIPAG